jgi:predicted ribonuclease YlaK
MKNFFLFTLFFAFSRSYAQHNTETEKKELQEKVNLFFKALETKDTVLYNTLVYPNAQIWTIRPQQDVLKIAMRSFSDDMIGLVAMKTVIEEKPLSYENT